MKVVFLPSFRCCSAMLNVKSASFSIFTRSKLWEGTSAFGRRGIFLSLLKHKTPVSTDPVDELKFDVSEEELEKKRFKAHLNDNVYRVFIKKEFPPPVNKGNFRKNFLRRLYGKYGEQSGLNPGIAWPTREELHEIIEHDKMFHPSLREMLDNVSAAEQEKMRERLEYEAEVEQNLEKLEVYKKEYYAKIAKKQAAAEASKLKQQQLIEEISELLGYDVSPKDPKFQEAVEMKKKEEKKAQRAKKEKESHERMLAKLASIAASRKKAEAAAENQTEIENATNQGSDENLEKVQASKETLPTSK